MADETVIKIGFEGDPSSVVSVPLFRCNHYALNRIFKVDIAYLIDQFGVILWPDAWERECKPHPWKYSIRVVEQKHGLISTDDDLTYEGDSAVFAINVPNNVKEPDLVAWFRAGLASYSPDIIAASKEVADAKLALQRLEAARSGFLYAEGITTASDVDEELPADVRAMPKMRALIRKRKVLREAIPKKTALLNELIRDAQDLDVRFEWVRMQGTETDPDMREGAITGITAEILGLSKVQFKEGGKKEVTVDEKKALKDRLHTWQIEVLGDEDEETVSRAAAFEEWPRVQLIAAGEDPENVDEATGKSLPLARYVKEGEDLSETSEGEDLMRRLRTYGTNMREVTVVRLRNGKGTCKTADGLHRVYAGDWRVGQRHGRGVEIGPDGLYEGEYADNQRSGKGTLRTIAGDTYEGEFDTGGRDQSWPPFVDGDWGQIQRPLDMRLYLPPPVWPIREMAAIETINPYRKGLPDGIGTMTFADGSTYTGNMRNGKPNGVGLYVSCHGERRDGVFKDGELADVSKWRTRGGVTRKGLWRHGHMHGHGVEAHDNGDSLECHYSYGVAEGRGTAISHRNTVKYTGYFRDTRRDGYGETTILDDSGHGARISGYWTTGKPRVRSAARLLRPASEQRGANDKARPRFKFVSGYGPAGDGTVRALIDKEAEREFDENLVRKGHIEAERARVARKRAGATRAHRERWQTARRTWKHHRFAAEDDESDWSDDVGGDAGAGAGAPSVSQGGGLTTGRSARTEDF